MDRWADWVYRRQVTFFLAMTAVLVLLTVAGL